MNVTDAFFAMQGWYPGQEEKCRQAVDDYLDQSDPAVAGQAAGIVPHAGWLYSGGIAAQSFAALRALDPQVVFLFGGHLRPHDPCTCLTTGALGNPLGAIAVEEQIAAEMTAALDCLALAPDRFGPDNTIELQLPFIRHAWPQAQAVVLQVPPGPIAESVGEQAARIAAKQGKRAVAIGSTDLTHYGSSYGFAPEGSGEAAHRWSKENNDRPFLDKLLAFDSQGAVRHALAHHSACCAGAAAAAVAFARARGLSQGRLLDHRTSHEVEGRAQPEMWVGYAAMVF